MKKMTLEDVRARLGGEIDPQTGRLVLPEPLHEKVSRSALKDVFRDARLAGQCLILQHTIVEQGDAGCWTFPTAPTTMFFR